MSPGNANKPTQRRSVAGRRASVKQPTKRASAPRESAPKKRPSVASTPKPKQASRPASHASPAASRKRQAPARKASFWERVRSSRVAIALIAVVCVIAVIGVFDAASNWGKAYGNVSVNGVNVAGMTAEEMTEALKDEFGARASHAQVTIYANEEARTRGARGEPVNETAVADQLSVEDAYASVGSWNVDALSLKATVPYEDAVARAMAVGRDDGGIARRISLLFSGEDVPLEVKFDEGLLENLAGDIDLAIGNPRVDATVEVAGGHASVVPGHSGTLVDRSWLAHMISNAMIDGSAPDSFVAQAAEAQSRIGDAQAAEFASALNGAISEGVLFSYRGRTWLAGPAALGDWTRVSVAGDEGSWHLEARIDTAEAIPVIVDKLGAAITSADVSVTMEDSGSGVVVHTEGSGSIPEVSAAAEQLQSLLYGDDGATFSASGAASTIEVGESSRPESLTLDEAVGLGVVTVIGECTTEFSNIEGTENRNHNIKLAADILDGYIVEANGGTWEFNEIAGDTDEEAGFWTAGSIVDGEIVDSVGGGICQVATTVFNAVLDAGLEVVERHNHTMYMANYPVGRDAAIDYPTDVDLVWRNSLDSDLYLRMSYTDTSVTAELYSVYTGYESEYDIGDWEKGEKYSVLFESDDSLGEGSYYRKSVGADGTKITVTRYVTDAKGASVLTDAFTSVYEPTDEVYVVGPGVDTSELVSSSSSSDYSDEVLAW